MSNIRRQSIISSIVIYIGFVVGLLNTYFFTKEGLFTTTEYGLTATFIAIATTMMAFANMAMPSYIFKFYPYYKDHLPAKKNDMITWALLISSIAFVLVMIAGWVFKDFVIRKFGQHSPELLTYYYWIFPLGFGLTIYTVLESFTWNIGKPVLTSFLKEVQWRLIITVLIVLFMLGIIKDFSLFIKLYAFTFPAIAVTLFAYLLFTKQIHFTFTVSKVSRRYFRKILTFCLFVYSGFIILTISQVFDTLVIAAVLPQGMDKAGIFGLAQIMTSVIQAPQRGLIAAAIPHLSRAWKEKNMELLQKIYQRSSINQLVFAAGLFCLIALNYEEAIRTFQLKDAFLLGFDAFILLGITRVIDMGTGVNGQIIGTSNYWRFELISGVALLAVILPLSYILTKQYDILGPAIASLISITLYNIIRIVFLWKKFRLFPFSVQTVYAILVASICYFICYYLFLQIHGFAGLMARSLAFIILYGAAVFYFKLSPDINPVVNTIKKRLGLKKKMES
jgi:O-antigen/teichoic acid export membrane protein